MPPVPQMPPVRQRGLLGVFVRRAGAIFDVVIHNNCLSMLNLYAMLSKSGLSLVPPLETDAQIYQKVVTVSIGCKLILTPPVNWEETP